jgi:hypothetical protein
MVKAMKQILAAQFIMNGKNNASRELVLVEALSMFGFFSM